MIKIKPHSGRKESESVSSINLSRIKKAFEDVFLSEQIGIQERGISVLQEK